MTRRSAGLEATVTHEAPLTVVSYDPTWPSRFAVEAKRVLACFEPDVARLEHVGSTAVPGLDAKPIVDMMLGTERMEAIEACIPALVDLGYEYIAEHEAVMPERRFLAFPKDRPRSFHLHAVEIGSAFWRRHLLFRNFLRAHPEEARSYAELKHELAARFDSDREGYTDAKTEFIRERERRAEREFA